MRVTRAVWPLTLVALLVAVGTARCDGDDADQNRTGADLLGVAQVFSITAVLTDSSLSLDPPRVTGGKAGAWVSFAVQNRDDTAHSFVVVADEAADDALPIRDGRVDLSSNRVSVLERLDAIGAGEIDSLLVRAMQPGSYVVLANEPGAYEAGLWATFTVEAPTGGEAGE